MDETPEIVVEKVVGMVLAGGVFVSCGIVVLGPLMGILVPCPRARGARSIEEDSKIVVVKVVGMTITGGVVVSCAMVFVGIS
jgi:hypothetical protein